MMITIDFNGEDPIYLQLRNQIIHSIAARELTEGDQLPSVRAMAEYVGINMHTVNKAYALLRQEGFLKLDRRTGAVVAVDIDHIKALSETRENLRYVLARAVCRGVDREEAHELLDDIYDGYM